MPGVSAVTPERLKQARRDWEKRSIPPDDSWHDLSAISWAHDYAAELLDYAERAQAENEEQARLLGMGSEREARLLAQIATMQRVVEAAKAWGETLRIPDYSAHIRNSDALRAAVDALEEKP